MKDVITVFDNLIERAVTESKQPAAMKHEMAIRQFMLLNTPMDDLTILAREFSRMSNLLEEMFVKETLTDADMLLGTLPNLETITSVDGLGEEAIMVLTNITIDRLLSEVTLTHSEASIEEVVNLHAKIRPLFEEIVGNELDEGYQPITYKTFELYSNAVEVAKENQDEIEQGNLESLKPLYSPELMNSEAQIDDLYSFIIKFRYDLALIWAIKQKMMRIEPLLDHNDTEVDWQLEMTEEFSEKVTESLVLVLTKKLSE